MGARFIIQIRNNVFLAAFLQISLNRSAVENFQSTYHPFYVFTFKFNYFFYVIHDVIVKPVDLEFK